MTRETTRGAGYCFRSHIGVYLQAAIVIFLIVDWAFDTDVF